VAVRAFEGGPLVSHPLGELREQLPDIDAKVVAIYRLEQPVPVMPDTVIQPGDEVFVLAASARIRDVMCELRRRDHPVRRIMIAGGGNIGLRLARTLEAGHNVKVIEAGKRRAEFLAGQLTHALVLQGDVTDEDLLNDEQVDQMDLFVSVTNDDEANIMSALLAKRMGARRVIALINRRAYGELVQGGQIDIAISPAQATLGSLLEHIRRGDVEAVHSVRRGRGEALEVVAHGDPSSSKVVGKRLRDVGLPKGASVAAIVRGELAIVRDAEHKVIESDDHIVLFLESKRIIAKVEALFQVGVRFF
jgi:trk system potassium uptake protein TrkA